MLAETRTVSDLRAIFHGRVITPDDSEYDEARTIFYGGFDCHPAAIVRVANAADVARIVSFARECGMELAVRSGGHSLAGQSTTEGGIVLDLAEMKALEIDADHRTAWAQTGLTVGEYTNAASAYGLATGFGDTGSVGIGGITLSGGVGLLVRKYGLAIDDLLAAEIVTADGQLLRADAKQNPDLFWAIRGGGGNFGVATRFQFRLHDLKEFVGGFLVLPATPEIIASFIELADAAPEELTTIANILPAPPMPFLPPEQHGKLILMATLCYAGAAAAGEPVLAPFRALTKPLADLVRPMPYAQMFPPENLAFHPTAVSRTMFIDKVDRVVAENVITHLNASDAAMRAIQLRVLGGAMARVPYEATAFAHRHSRIMVNVAAFYNGQDRAVREAWVSEFAASLHQKDTGAYVGFLGAEGTEEIQNAYPDATLKRLAAIKRRYDPTNLFHLNQNIPPAPQGRK